MSGHAQGGNDTFTSQGCRPATFSTVMRVATCPTMLRAATNLHKPWWRPSISPNFPGGGNTFYGDAGGNMSGHAGAATTCLLLSFNNLAYGDALRCPAMLWAAMTP